MKKILAVVFMALMLLSGCNSSTTSTKLDPIPVGDGEFLVTPQNFIERWNNAVVNFQNNSENSNAQNLFILPDFSESGKSIEIKSRGLEVTYTANSKTSNLSKVEFQYFQPVATKEESLNWGFISGSIPDFMNPDTDFDITKEFNLQYRGTDSDIAFDGNYKYQYTVVNGDLYSLTVSTKS